MPKGILDLLSVFLGGGALGAVLTSLVSRYNNQSDNLTKKEGIFAEHYTELVTTLKNLMDERNDLQDQISGLHKQLDKQSQKIDAQNEQIRKQCKKIDAQNELIDKLTKQIKILSKEEEQKNGTNN